MHTRSSTQSTNNKDWGKLPLAAKIWTGAGFHLNLANVAAWAVENDPHTPRRVRRNQLLDEIDRYHQHGVRLEKQGKRSVAKSTALNKAADYKLFLAATPGLPPSKKCHLDSEAMPLQEKAVALSEEAWQRRMIPMVMLSK